MKKLIMLCCLVQCMLLNSCWHHSNDISIRYQDNSDSYTMDARFGRNKTRKAERYMNDMIGRENNMSFINTRTDAVFTLDDGSKFYMKKSPGHILIRMKREESSDRAFHAMKEMCVGLKDVVLR